MLSGILLMPERVRLTADIKANALKNTPSGVALARNNHAASPV
jgi:hypothetical protein